MAARKRKKITNRRVRKTREPELTKLDEYAIQLNEYYKALKRAGFDHSVALAIVLDKEGAPNWFIPTPPDITHIPLDDDEDDE